MFKLRLSLSAVKIEHWFIIATAFSFAYSLPVSAANCTNAPVTGKYYSIINSGSGNALDISGKSTANGGNLIQWPYKSGANQQFSLTDLGNGYWSIQSSHSGRVLDVSGQSTRDGANIAQWDYHGGENQQWQLKKSSTGAFNIVARHSHKSMTVGDSSSGANVHQQADTASSYQRWYFNPVDGTCANDPGANDSEPTDPTPTDPTPADAGNSQDKAVGFGRAVTGGAGGETVRVTTVDQLREELCRSSSGGICTDNMPRVIEVASTIDFTDSEGSAQGQGCYATEICTAPKKSEVTLKYRDSDTHCDGKTMFDITYKKAARSGLLVGSNKTLIGVGRAGVIKGKGLLLKGGVSNIIIRNLSFTDIAQGLVFGGDGITVADASRVWIDHNYFARIGRQMIVTGTGDKTGQVTDMTMSWNEFDGRNEYSPFCDGKHYWNLLFYGKGDFTFANNWIHDFSGRAPKIDNDDIVQVVNNYFQNGSKHALDTSSSARVLVEGNDFQNVSAPISKDSSNVYALSASSSTADSACQAVLGRSCVPNQLDSASSGDNFRQDSAVLNAIGSVSGDAIITPVTAGGVSSRVQSGAGVGKI